MPQYTRDKYLNDCTEIRTSLKGKRPIEYIIKNYFPKYKGERRRKLRLHLVNSLNGNSFSKTKSLKLIPIFIEVYNLKTGKTFERTT
jgi:hypothetical protein